MQRVFITDLHHNVAAMFGEPRLVVNKSHLVNYNGLQQIWKGARWLGALSVVISVFLFDRPGRVFCCSSLSKGGSVVVELFFCFCVCPLPPQGGSMFV